MTRRVLVLGGAFCGRFCRTCGVGVYPWSRLMRFSGVAREKEEPRVMNPGLLRYALDESLLTGLLARLRRLDEHVERGVIQVDVALRGLERGVSGGLLRDRAGIALHPPRDSGVPEVVGA